MMTGVRNEMASEGIVEQQRIRDTPLGLKPSGFSFQHRR
jgi:hypothetical protein